MKIRILGLVVGVSSLAIWGTACEQAQIDCRVLHGDFAAKYTNVSGGAECSKKTGDIIGLQSYYAAKADPNSSDRKIPDPSTSLLSIGTADLPGIIADAADYGDASTTVSKSNVYATGNFKATEPDDTDACSIPDVMTSELSVTAIPSFPDDPATPDDDESYPGMPATDIKYEWKNVRILTTPANPGNLMEAELVYTENGCTATYNVIALSPVIDCTGEGDMPDNDLCDDKPDPKYGLGFGSGISPDLKAVCDPVMLVCVPTNTTLLAGGP